MAEKIQRGNTRLAVRAGAWYLISTFLIKGLSFITTPIFARLMDEASYGEFSNFASWQATLLIITGAELFNTLAPAYYDHTDEYDEYVSSVTVTSCFITAAFYGFFLLCGNWIFRIVSIPKQYVHVMFLLLTFQSCKSIFMARERTMYRYKTVAAISTVNLIVPTTIAMVLVATAPAASRLSARIYGYYIPSALIGVFCAAVLLKRGRFRFRLRHCKYALRLSLPLIVHYLTAYILTSSNTIITKSIRGAEETAFVSIAVSTTHILTMLFQALSGAVTTWMMDNLQQEKRKTVRKGTLVIVSIQALVTTGVILLAPEVVWILGGSRYAASVTLIPGLVFSVLVQSATTVFTIILTYKKDITKTATATGIVALLSVAAKILLVPSQGYQVLPAVNAVAFAVLFVVNYKLVRKAGYKDAVNFKGCCGILAAVLLPVCAAPFLYEHTAIRYGIIGLFAVVALSIAYKERSRIKILLQSRKRAGGRKKQEGAEA